MLADVLVVTLDDPYLFIGSNALAHNGKYTLPLFGLVGILVENLLDFRRNGEDDLAGILITFPRLMSEESQLLTMSGKVPSVIFQTQRVSQILPVTEVHEEKQTKITKKSLFCLRRV